MYNYITREGWDRLYVSVYEAYTVACRTDSNARKLLGDTRDPQ